MVEDDSIRFDSIRFDDPVPFGTESPPYPSSSHPRTEEFLILGRRLRPGFSPPSSWSVRYRRPSTQGAFGRSCVFPVVRRSRSRGSGRAVLLPYLSIYRPTSTVYHRITLHAIEYIEPMSYGTDVIFVS